MLYILYCITTKRVLAKLLWKVSGRTTGTPAAIFTVRRTGFLVFSWGSIDYDIVPKIILVFISSISNIFLFYTYHSTSFPQFSFPYFILSSIVEKCISNLFSLSSNIYIESPSVSFVFHSFIPFNSIS